MILSAKAIASEMAASEAGECLPSHCVNFRAARMQTAIRSTRFLLSSTSTSVADSLFIRHKGICLSISHFRNLHSVGQFGEGVHEEVEDIKRPAKNFGAVFFLSTTRADTAGANQGAAFISVSLA